MERNLFLVTLVVASAFTILAAIPPTAKEVHADLLAKDDIPDLPINGNITTLGEIDVAISPYDGYLPANGTLSISTLGANDLDINAMPPAGMTIVIDNDTASITSNPVRIDMNPQTAAAAADTGSGGDEDEE